MCLPKKLDYLHKALVNARCLATHSKQNLKILLVEDPSQRPCESPLPISFIILLGDIYYALQTGEWGPRARLVTPGKTSNTMLVGPGELRIQLKLKRRLDSVDQRTLAPAKHFFDVTELSVIFRHPKGAGFEILEFVVI